MGKLLLGAMLGLAAPMLAQDWSAGSDLGLIRQAAELRARRDADTLLAGWQATARGVVRFAALMDQETGPVERLIKADELLVEVYGEGPSRSKQVIVAWRDTTITPTSIRYHRDHLGIIASDFGPTIRLGDGDEVRDVPHPLSAAGLVHYQFRLGDTLVISSASGTIRVVLVEVRPADLATPGVVGTLAIDVDRAALVRASFSFTAAAYRDPTVSSISVVLENALEGAGIWLPWRQAIAIYRGSAILSLPIETVIRADWTIEDYRFGIRHRPALFLGPAVGGLQQVGGSARFSEWGEVIGKDGLSGEEIRHASEQAAALVGPHLLDGLPRLMLAPGGGVSRMLRINRVEGVTLGGGFRWRAPAGTMLEASAGVATATGLVTGRIRVSRPVAGMRMVVNGTREVVDANPWPRRSGLANSVATLIAGDDAGDWYLASALGLRAEKSAPGWNGALGVRREKVEPLESRFGGFDDELMANPHLVEPGAWLVTAHWATTRKPGGVALGVEYAAGARDWLRLQLEGNWELPAGFRLSSQAGWGSSGLPPHRRFLAGGAGSLTGTVPRAVGGSRLVRLELERPFDVALGLPLGGRFTAASLGSRIGPFLALAAAGGVADSLMVWPPPREPQAVWVVGMRMDLWGPLLRLELGWAPAAGTLGVAFDAHPDWWGLL